MTDYTDWLGLEVVDGAGDRVGRVRDVFVDDETNRPVWLAVSTGMLEKHPSFVPVGGAGTSDGRVMIDWDRATVKDSPRAGREGGDYLSPEEVDELWNYYEPRRRRTAGTATGPAVDSDGFMTRSEERAHFGVRRQEVGRARLRRYVVSERVTEEVAVSHEEIRVERVPLIGAERLSVAVELSEQEYELTLFAERPTVEKEVVAVERIRLSKQLVVGEETVSTHVRKEQIAAETDAEGPRRQARYGSERFAGEGGRT
jgi:stress response protein YsnF/sporulation protein YlmC with PRC-barrel domain